jgi:hypothetical protein
MPVPFAIRQSYKGLLHHHRAIETLLRRRPQRLIYQALTGGFPRSPLCAIVIFWPAAFFVSGDKQTAAELAQMKGQMVAVEQASIAKKCNIEFQGQRPPGT